MSLKENKIYKSLVKVEHTKYFFPVMLSTLIILSTFGVFRVSNNNHSTPKQAKKVIVSTKPKSTSKPVNTNPAPVAVSKPNTVASNVPKVNPTPTNPIVPTNSVLPSPSSGVNSLTPTPTPSNGGSNTSSNTNSSNNSSPSTYHPSTSYRSTNWSGYVAEGNNFNAVSGNWKIPSYSYSGGTMSADAAWIGIGGASSQDLIQLGTVNSVDSMNNKVTYAFYELLPDYATIIPTIDISIGDKISASIKQNSSSNWHISISDLTSGQSYQADVSYQSSLSSAEWIEEDPSNSKGNLVPLTIFSTVFFTDCHSQLEGSSLDIAGLGSSNIFLVNQNTLANIAVPSDVTNGTDFSVSHL